MRTSAAKAAHRANCQISWADHDRPQCAARRPSECSRRRRPPRRPTDRRERSVAGNGDTARLGNLTTINLLPPVEAPTGFAELGVPERIDVGLAACGFAQPFAIQTEAIPVAMQGRDVCGRAKTGSGKTLAFGVPMLARITDVAEPRAAARARARADARARRPGGRGARRRSPARPACACCPSTAAPAGTSRSKRSAKGVEIVVATPLRLIDLLKSGEVDVGASRSSCSTRPTAWPTTASRRRSSGSCATAPAAARRCCSRRRSTATSAT